MKLTKNNVKNKRNKEREERKDILEKKLETIPQAGIQVEPIVVPDYHEKEIKKCTEQIEQYIKDHVTLDNMEFTEEKRIEYNLVPFCIDKMISGGIFFDKMTEVNLCKFQSLNCNTLKC